LLRKHGVVSERKICSPNRGRGTTITVYLRNRTIKVNALLDDANIKTYINSDVAAELGLQGQLCYYIKWSSRNI